MERFFLDRDCDAHWYIVPLNKKEEWESWRNLDEEDELAWEAPEWAIRLGCSHFY